MCFQPLAMPDVKSVIGASTSNLKVAVIGSPIAGSLIKSGSNTLTKSKLPTVVTGHARQRGDETYLSELNSLTAIHHASITFLLPRPLPPNLGCNVGYLFGCRCRCFV